MVQYKNMVPLEMSKGTAAIINLGTTYQGDANANRVGVYVFEYEKSVTLSGQCAGICRRNDGNEVPLTGTVSGNMAYVTLDGNCYAAQGPITVLVKLVSGNDEITLAAAFGNVETSGGTALIQPVEHLPDYAQLLAEISNMRTATAAANTAATNANGATGYIAPTEASSTASAAHAAGTYFVYGGVLYRATADIASGGSIVTSGSGQNCEAVKLGDEVSDVKSAISNQFGYPLTPEDDVLFGAEWENKVVSGADETYPPVTSANAQFVYTEIRVPSGNVPRLGIFTNDAFHYYIRRYNSDGQLIESQNNVTVASRLMLEAGNIICFMAEKTGASVTTISDAHDLGLRVFKPNFYDIYEKSITNSLFPENNDFRKLVWHNYAHYSNGNFLISKSEDSAEPIYANDDLAVDLRILSGMIVAIQKVSLVDGSVSSVGQFSSDYSGVLLRGFEYVFSVAINSSIGQSLYPAYKFMYVNASIKNKNELPNFEYVRGILSPNNTITANDHVLTSGTFEGNDKSYRFTSTDGYVFNVSEISFDETTATSLKPFDSNTFSFRFEKGKKYRICVGQPNWSTTSTVIDLDDFTNLNVALLGDSYAGTTHRFTVKVNCSRQDVDSDTLLLQDSASTDSNSDLFSTIDWTTGLAGSGESIEGNPRALTSEWVKVADGWYSFTSPNGYYYTVQHRTTGVLFTLGTSSHKVFLSSEEEYRFCVATPTWTDSSTADIDSDGYEQITVSIYGNAYVDNGFIMLPDNYTDDGEPTRLIISCHGAGGTVTTDDSQVEHQTVTKYLVANGFAVMDVAGLPTRYATEKGINALNNIGSPIAMQCYIKAYEYVMGTFNLHKSVLLMGASMGGITSTNLCMSGAIPVTAQGGYCPVLDTYNEIFLHPWSGGAPKNAMGIIYDFDKDSGNNWIYDESKLVGYNPVNNLTVVVDDNRYTFYPCPVKWWHCDDDTIVSPTVTVGMVEAIKNAGRTAYLRKLPSGGHEPQDAGDNINNPSGNVVFRGETLNIKPVVEETFLWFERYK